MHNGMPSRRSLVTLLEFCSSMPRLERVDQRFKSHRVDLLPPPVYYGDADDGPVVHDLTGVSRVTESWGLPPRLTWLTKASFFEGVDCVSPPPSGRPEPSLEAYFGMR